MSKIPQNSVIHLNHLKIVYPSQYYYSLKSNTQIIYAILSIQDYIIYKYQHFSNSILFSTTLSVTYTNIYIQ